MNSVVAELQAQFDASQAWRAANHDKIGTPEYRKRVLTEPVLIALIRGAPIAAAGEVLASIEAGTHPDSM